MPEVRGAASIHHRRRSDRAAFGDAALCFAFQIAAARRPPEPGWDVSRDGSVTSLDALMILQAAAGINRNSPAALVLVHPIMRTIPKNTN
jgi:hypothetical protein